MKLLFDVTELSYYHDKSGHRAGVFNVALNLLNEFKKLGIDISVCCDYRRRNFLHDIQELSGLPLLDEHSVINKLWGNLIYLTDKFPIRIKYAILILSRYYNNYFYRQNKKNIQQLKNFDIYFSPFTPPSKEIECSQIKRFRMLHDTIPIIENGYPKSPKDWYYCIYETINKSDYYITNSENTKNDVLKYFPFVDEKHIKTSYLGFSENFNEPSNIESTKNNSKYVFSLCTLGKRKNLIFTIRNFFEFIEKHNINDLKLVLAGGIWKKFEKELYKEIGKFDKSKIEILGYVKDYELPVLYSNAMMFVYPSLYEGFGLPVLEAMASGCPVITSNVSSLPEVIGDAGIKINPTSDEEMVQAFEKMYFDNFYRELCSERGKIRAKNFSWEKCAEQILEFIQNH